MIEMQPGEIVKLRCIMIDKTQPMHGYKIEVPVEIGTIYVAQEFIEAGKIIPLKNGQRVKLYKDSVRLIDIDCIIPIEWFERV